MKTNKHLKITFLATAALLLGATNAPAYSLPDERPAPARAVAFAERAIDFWHARGIGLDVGHGQVRVLIANDLSGEDSPGLIPAGRGSDTQRTLWLKTSIVAAANQTGDGFYRKRVKVRRGRFSRVEVYNSDRDSIAAKRFEAEVILHEMGHVLGWRDTQGHDDDPYHGDSGGIMGKQGTMDTPYFIKKLYPYPAR